MVNDTLTIAMAELDEDKVLNLVHEKLANNESTMKIISLLQLGMVEVGKRFEADDYFLSELVMSGEILKSAMKILEPYISNEKRVYKGNIVIGTVKGDIHDLGKNLVVMLLKGVGYKVIDLGIDVPKEKFIEAVKNTKAGLVGLSVLLTGCQEAMKDTIDAIRNEGLDTKVIIGGNYIDEFVMNYVGANYYARSASDGVKIAQQVFK